MSSLDLTKLISNSSVNSSLNPLTDHHTKDVWDDFVTSYQPESRALIRGSPLIAALWDSVLISAQVLDSFQRNRTKSIFSDILNSLVFETQFSGSMLLATQERQQPIWISESTVCNSNNIVRPSFLRRVTLGRAAKKALQLFLRPLPQRLTLRVAVCLPMTVSGYNFGRSQEWAAAIAVAAEGLSRRHNGLVIISTTVFDTNQDCYQVSNFFGFIIIAFSKLFFFLYIYFVLHPCFN